MRNLLTLVCLGIVSLSFACGDADSGSSTRRGSGTHFDPSNPDDDPGEQVDGTPTAETPVTPPTTAATTTGSFTVAVDKNALSMDLNQKQTVTVTITPTGGFTGAVQLAVDGLPTGAKAVFTPASVTLGATPVTATAEITSAFSPGTSALTFKGTSGTQSATAAANMAMQPKITVTIPANVAALNAAANNTILSSQFAADMKAGTVITFVNKSGANFTVHSGGSIQHGNLLADGASETRTPTMGSSTSYWHDPPQGQNGQNMKVQVNWN